MIFEPELMDGAKAVWLKGCVFNRLDGAESSFLSTFQSIILRLQDNTHRGSQSELTDISAPLVWLNIGDRYSCWRNQYLTGGYIQVKVAKGMAKYW